jgi:hypothetical protein
MIIQWRPSTDANFYQISDAEITSGLALNVGGTVRYVHRVTINQGGTLQDCRVVVNQDGTIYNILNV